MSYMQDRLIEENYNNNFIIDEFEYYDYEEDINVYYYGTFEDLCFKEYYNMD